jgi:uncharacterized FlaG/YvyC family protein
MNVSLDPNSSVNAAAASAQQPARPARQTSVPKREAAPAPAKSSVPSQLFQTNVTFRKDSGGQIYYVFTDSESGRELRELPPEAVRKVGEGIAEFLQQQDKHLDTKG